MLDPMVFLIAIAAVNGSPFSRGRFTIHYARPNGIETREVGGDLFRPTGARDYLRQLVADCLDPDCADLLPFSVFRENFVLRKAFVEEEHEDSTYPAQLRDEVERKAGYAVPRLAELAEAGFRVPDTALAKIRRRFLPLFQALNGEVRIEQDETAADEVEEFA